MRTFLLWSLIALTPGAYATPVYKHIPFNMQVRTVDTIVVNYDYSQKIGIACTASAAPVQVAFNYKGNDKTATLPITLMSDHLPKNASEVLADVTGSMTFSPSSNSKHKGNYYTVHCIYLHQ